MSFYTKNKEGFLVDIPMEKVETLLNNDVKVYTDKDLISELSFEIEELKNENARITQLAIYYKQVLEEISKCYHPVGLRCDPSYEANIAREALARVNNENN